MEQVLSVWNALEMRRRIIVVAATIAVFAAVLGLARMAAAPNLALLYAGLEPGPAGEVVASLDVQGVAYEIRGGAIYVDATQRDSLRMTLASEGLPANSSKGYELLDDLSGFGTTSQMFDAAYWRAKEGELARTIMSSPHVSLARVHIGTPTSQGLRPRGQPTASVTVTTGDGALDGSHAKALKYLVASAVPGLAPEDVSVIDSRGGLVQSGDGAAPSGNASDRAEVLKHNIERLLEARVGFGNAVVELSIDTAQENERILERRFDPDERVAISTDTTETANTANESGAGGVTVASNLPAGDAGAGSTSTSNNSETRERVNYEVSETTREIERGPGGIRRLTVAVLVDGLRTVNAAGEEVWVPREDAELEALRDLVAGAVGFDEARGDQITIKSMEFEPIMEVGSEGAPNLLTRLGVDVMALAKLLILALVTLVLGLFVVRPLLTNPAVQSEALPAPSETGPGGGAEADLPALTGEIDDGDFPGPELARMTDIAIAGEGGPPALTGGEADPVERLRALIEERQAETVEILRGWMEDDREERA